MWKRLFDPNRGRYSFGWYARMSDQHLDASPLPLLEWAVTLCCRLFGHTPVLGRPRVMSAVGVVSRVSPVQTALRNCTRDEGGPFEFGNQVLISSHRKPLSSKAMVVNVAETLGHDLSRHGRERRAQANRCRSVESGLGDVKTGGSPALRDQLGGCPDSVRAASGVQAARSSTRLLCGT